MLEAGLIVGLEGQPLCWHTPQNRTSVALPDVRSFWDAIWDHRHQILGIAHSHPGRGIVAPSHEDITTFIAVEEGLGKRLFWWIVNENHILVMKWESGCYFPTYLAPKETPSWVPELRRLSEYQ